MLVFKPRSTQLTNLILIEWVLNEIIENCNRKFVILTRKGKRKKTAYRHTSSHLAGI